MFIRHSRCLGVYATPTTCPTRLHRYYGAGYSHFITTSGYQRLPLLGSARNRDLFLRVFEQVRRDMGHPESGSLGSTISWCSRRKSE
jgi:hypothetical protein